MTIEIICAVPELLTSPFEHSIMKRAQERGLLTIRTHSLRKWAINKHGQIDDYQYGGGAGMVMMCEPLANAIDELQLEGKFDEIIFMTPDGITFDQKEANTLSLKNRILVICGHYKGIDQRIRDLYVTKEISIGDYVLSGGELGALVLCDALIRLIPGVLSDETSALTDSFQDNLLSGPIYTRPADYKGWKVPEVLTSGNFAKIDKWREDMAYEHTKNRRPDLLEE